MTPLLYHKPSIGSVPRINWRRCIGHVHCTGWTYTHGRPCV